MSGTASAEGGNMSLLRFLVLLAGLLQSATVIAKIKVIEIPYSTQYRAYTCGHNSFRMVMGYWGTRLSRNEILLKEQYFLGVLNKHWI